MTNGEKIQQMFPRKCPHIGFNENFGRIWLMQNGEDFANFTLKWWNAEYKEPTIKNNLGVDLISREQALVAIRNLYPGMPRVDFNGSLRKWVDKYKPYIECDDAIKLLPSVAPQLSVPEVTALAEWTTKLTKASEDAYNKGYADGMKAQQEPKTKIEESNFSREQYALDIDTAWKCGYEAGKKENAPVNICPHCGEYIGEEE